jgi:hypothetical protein
MLNAISTQMGSYGYFCIRTINLLSWSFLSEPFMSCNDGYEAAGAPRNSIIIIVLRWRSERNLKDRSAKMVCKDPLPKGENGEVGVIKRNNKK